MTSVPPDDSATAIREPTVVTTLRSLEDMVRRPACLVVIHGDNIGHKYDLDVKVLRIGRGRDNDICVNHRSVSRNHVEVHVDERGAQLRDLRSTNGTFVNDQPVGNVYLRDGDRIKVGRTVLKFISGGNVEAAYHEQLFTMTRYDALTGVHNRRSFDEKVETEVARADRYTRPLALLLFDIDHFKRCNDTFGHRAGDHVLREVAQLVQRRARKHDFVARYGGEEFVVMLNEFELPGPQVFAELIRGMIEHHEFEFEGKQIPITISIGLVIWGSQYERASQLIEAADQCLYRAKAEGRNRVIVAPDPAQDPGC
ncbi:Response regulator PleD [Enhygromyxa salina]|uniref:diguanylate cyclase n=1 Tax=Enhygromyxa salina TaxID=215803 RepID=A0A2S9XHC0_9BACT|nr:GGDEF domain-containing protein [Enhygromyxa salina]PRP92130.1 Response regulator PleD [Enhygromyxa salina]